MPDLDLEGWHAANPDAPAGLLEAFAAYETALGCDDLAAMDDLFADAPDTLRGDPGGLLVGHQTIHDFRAVRGGAPARTLAEVRVLPLAPDAACIVAVTAPARGGHGLQTQVWQRETDGAWRVRVAHVAPPPPSFDRSVWRVVGDPLAVATGTGVLDGQTLAVKDLFAVAGHAIGAGVPEFLAEAPAEEADSAAVARLRAAGASVAGISRTDQFAYSLAGDNPHYGTPVNPAVPGALPGGSSSGSAVAVSLGGATIGLATDTGGSVRVPASYQGLWGWRSTHGLVPADGLLPLAPDFDTVGVLTRDPGLLARTAEVLLDGVELVDEALTSRRSSLSRPSTAVADKGFRQAQPSEPGIDRRFLNDSDEAPRLVVAAALPTLEDGVTDTFDAWVASHLPAADDVALPDLGAAAEAFRVHQAYQAWQQHGAWVDTHPGALRGAAGERFATASAITAEDDRAASATLATIREELDSLLGDATLVLPSAAGPAPRVWASAATVDAHRQATFRLTCIAGITGRPAVSAPLIQLPAGPLGVCLVGPRGSDPTLIAQAARLAH